MARKLIGTAVTDENGEATITYTGTGAGKLNIVAESGTFLSETYEVVDAIYYDTCTMDTSSRYSVNTSVGNSIGFVDNSLRLQVGSSNRYVAADTNQSAFTLSDYTGKSIRFKVDVNPSRSCALQIVQVVDGQNQVTTSDYVNSQSTISIDASIDENATRIQFRVLANGTGATTGDTVNINNWTIYEI